MKSDTASPQGGPLADSLQVAILIDREESTLKLATLFLAMAGLAAAQRVPIVFDTDIGDDIDDALALALALQSPELDVKAITTVIDRSEQRSRLVWKELGLFGRQDIPIGTGADEPLLDPVRGGRHAQFDVLTAADVVPGPPRRAVDLIVRTLLDSPRKITLVPVGPLTNIALALKTEPRIKEKIERIVLMGGAYYTQQPEYNIYRDRIASEIVFRSGVPITGVGLDVTTRCKLKAEDIERLKAAGHPSAAFLVRLIELWRETQGNRYPTLHDPLAMAVAAQPSLVETQLGRVQVETASPMLYGLTLFTPADRLPKDAAAPNTLVARNVDVERFLSLFMERLSARPRTAAASGDPRR
jgi:purine nucleosidase/pyrimidine-specific ribonucleoside hydrolase